MPFLTQILSVKWKKLHTTPTPCYVLIRLDGMLTKIKSNIYALYSLDPPSPGSPFKKGTVNFNYLSWRGGELWKIKKGMKVWCRVQFFLKGGGWHFSYLIFSRFIIFKFRNFFVLCKIALYVGLCYHNLWKKSFEVV